MDGQSIKGKINRRMFLRSATATGAGLTFSPAVFSRITGGTKPDVINVALLGAGAQGHRLMEIICLRNIPGVRIKAVCDIWTEFNQRKTSHLLQRHNHAHNVYEDYREMLDEEKKNLDAVIIATPDFWHSRQTVACLETGLHVYCEPEMSNTVEGAKAMVEAARRTGKLLQIGRQRRSNPMYIHCFQKLLNEAKLLGRITTVNGQWNRSKRSCEDRGWPGRHKIDDATLNKYEFESMHQFRNWQWYKGKGGGQIVTCGSHQIDVFSWFLEADPTTVIADGGIDFWKGRMWYDNVVASFEYQTKEGPVRAIYQTITTNDSGGYYEKFLGIEGTLVISEHTWGNRAERQRWVNAEKWESWVKKGYLKSSTPPKTFSESGIEIIPDPSLPSSPPSYDITIPSKYRPYHLLHLENFFDAIRGKAMLNCPAEVGYKTTVAVLKVNEAIEAGRKLKFQPDEFVVYNPHRKSLEHIIGIKLPKSVTNCRYHSKDYGMGRGSGWGYFEIARADLQVLVDSSDHLPDVSELGHNSGAKFNIEKYLEREGESLAWWKPLTLQKRRYAQKIIGSEEVTDSFALSMLPAMNICVGEIREDWLGVYLVYHCG